MSERGLPDVARALFHSFWAELPAVNGAYALFNNDSWNDKALKQGINVWLTI